MSEKVYVVNSVDVVSEVIDGEAILIDMRTGCYYSLEGTACLLWARLVEAPSTASSLALRFDGANLTELTAFLDELASEKLLSCDGVEGEAVVEQGEKVPYSKPVLNKYTDMENLLLMDPIHDAGEQGWPVLPADGK